MDNIDQFVTNWDSKNAMVPISTGDISELEGKLNSLLPDSYKYLLSTYGLPHSPNVLTKICDLNAEVSAVQDFLSLDDVFSLTKLYEMTGMPKGYVVFASDCKGNMFCFKLTNGASQQRDIPVWFFDQGSQSVKQEANSFSKWLEGFINL